MQQREQLMQIATRLRELRDLCDYSQLELAQELGITPELLDDYEQGRVDIPVSILHAAAELMGVDLTELLTGHEDSLFFGFQLLEDGEEIACDSHLFVPEKSFALEDPEIEWNIIREEEGFRITLSAKKFARSVELSLEGMDGVFSDNYFDLCDGHEKTVFLPFEDITLQMGDITTGPVLRGITPDEISDRRLEKALRIRSLYDTYDHF